MDKLLLDALNNLSVSLENLTFALQQKSESKSDVAGTLSSGDLSKKLDEILSILKSNPTKPSPAQPGSSILPMSKTVTPSQPGTFVKKPNFPVIGTISPATAASKTNTADSGDSESKSVVSEKKSLSFTDTIKNFFSSKKSEEIKKVDNSKPGVLSTQISNQNISGPISAILVGPRVIIDWFLKRTSPVMAPKLSTPVSGPVSQISTVPTGITTPKSPIITSPVRPSIPTTGIVPPNVYSTIDGPRKAPTGILPSMRPSVPVTKSVSTTAPSILTSSPRVLSGIRPLVPTSTQVNTNPFQVGGSYTTMPVIPVAIVSFADGSNLLASSAQSRVVGRRVVPKEKKPSESMSRPATESATSSERSDRGGIFSRSRPSESMSRPATETVGKENEGKSGFFDPESKKRVKDGVQLLLLMAVGIVAIGLAFKLVGGVDFKSVLALAIALPLIAIAFEKISRIKVSPKDIGLISLALIAMSVAILLSSFFLSKVRPIGLAQAFSTIVIVGAFALVAHKLPAIFDGVSKVGPRAAIVGSLLLPVVLVALSFAIMASSNFIRNVKPIGIQQAFSTIIIGGMFAILAKRIPALVETVGKLTLSGVIKAALFLPLVLVGVSYAIMLSSNFIRNVKPIGIQQAFSTIVIAGTFAIISLSLGKLIKSFDNINPIKALVAAAIMPIVLIGVSYAIMKSSDFIRNVKPIGIQQAFSSLVIAATFTVLAFGVGKLLKAFDEVNPLEAAAFSILAPILLIAVSYAIMVSSKFISQVKPVGFLNFVSSIMISLVFVVLSFGLKKMVKAFDGISIGDAIKASIFIPIVFIALSWTIMKSSPFISKTKPVGWLNFIAAIMISIIFVAMSFAAKFIVQNTKNITAKDMLKAGGVLVAMAAATYLASLFIGMMPRIPSTQFETFVKLTLSLVAMAGAALAITKITQRIDKKEFFKGAVVIVGVAATIMLVSILLSSGSYTNLPSAAWVIGATLTIGTFAGVIFGAAKLNKIVGFKEMIKGALVVLVIAAAVMATSLILGLGSYDKYPTAAWSGGVGLSLLIFGIATATLGAAITLTAGLGAVALAAGIGAVIAIAASVLAVSKILSQGEYGVFPTNEWISGVAKTLLLFGTAVVTLGAIASGGAVLEGITFGLVKNPLDAGIDAVKKVSELVVETSSILAGGDYGNYPTDKWISGVAKTLLLFGTAIVTLGAISSGGGALEGISFGLIKNPITAGVDAIKAVSQSIVDADKILSTGSFSKGPKVEWSRGIGLALGEFSKVYKMLQGSQILSFFTGGRVGGGLETFVGTIRGISLAIKEAGDVLASGNFTGGPKQEWAKSISIALGAFAPVYSMLEKAQVMKLFSFGKLGVSVESFTAAIKTISSGIKTAADYLAVGKYNLGPKEEWAKGVGLAIGAFSKVYSILQEENLPKIFGGGVSIQAFKDAIVTISVGLKEAAIQLADPKIQWQGGPSETWASGVGKAINAFAPVFKAVSETGVIGPQIEDFKNAIVTISEGIIQAADTLGAANASFDLAKAPKAEWGRNVGEALKAFSPVFTYLSENSGWFKSGKEAADELQNAIRVVASAVKDSSITLSLGKYDYVIDGEWVTGLNNLFKDFIELFSNSKLDTDPDEMSEKSLALGTIASTVKNTSITLSLGKYDTDFGKFDKNVKAVFNSFIDIYKNVSKIDLDEELTKNSLKIARNIKDVSNILFVSKLNLKIDGNYGRSIKSIYDSYFSIYRGITNAKIDEKIIRTVQSVARSISSISIELARGKYDSKVPKNYFSELNTNVDNMIKIIKKLKSFNISDFGKLTLALSQIKVSSDKISQIKFSKIPDNWSDSISKLLNKFGELSKKIAKLPVNFKNLSEIVKNILITDKLLSSGRYRVYPESKWIDGVNNAIFKYSTIIIDANKRLLATALKSGIVKIESVLYSLVRISKLVASGTYTNLPSDKWINTLRGVVDKMGDISVLIDKKYNFSSLRSGLRKIELMSQTISQVSKSLALGSYTKYPSAEWAKGAYLSLQGFLNLKVPGSSLIDKLLGRDGAGIDKKKLAGVLDLIMMVDSTFSKGKFTNFPTVSWSDGVIKTLSKFSTILQLVDFSKFEKKFGRNIGLSKMVSDIGLLARVFDKLSESLQKVSSSIGLIDSGKIESIRTLTSNVVLLSLMDASQFDRMMSKLEENSQLFGHLLSDSKSGKKVSVGGDLVVDGKTQAMSSVKTPMTKTTNEVSSGVADQTKLMVRLVELMTDIASVAGSKGVLSEYLTEKNEKKEISGGFNFFGLGDNS